MIKTIVVSCVVGSAAALLVQVLPEILSSPEDQSVDEIQCGHWCVLRSCQLLGVPTTLERITEEMPARSDGHSLLDLQSLLSSYGVAAVPIDVTEAIVTEDQCPIIVHLSDPAHFVVVNGRQGSRFTIFDGAGRLSQRDGSRLLSETSGYGLRLTRDVNSGHSGLNFETLLIDRGQVSTLGGIIDYEFPVKNTSDAPLSILKVQTSCSCTSSAYPSQPLAPGEEKVITLRYGVGSERGPYMHEAQVHTNDSAMPFVTLTVAGNTNAEVMVMPSPLEFGESPFGTVTVAETFVRYSGDQESFEITDVDSGVPNVAVDVVGLDERNSPLAPGEPSRVYRLTATFIPDENQLGPVASILSLWTDVPGFELIEVPMRATVQLPVKVTPNPVSLQVNGRVPESEVKLNFRSRSGEAVEVVATEFCGKSVESLRSDDAPSNGGELRFRIPTADLLTDGEKTLKLTFRTVHARLEFSEIVKISAWRPEPGPISANLPKYRSPVRLGTGRRLSVPLSAKSKELLEAAISRFYRVTPNRVAQLLHVVRLPTAELSNRDIVSPVDYASMILDTNQLSEATSQAGNLFFQSGTQYRVARQVEISRIGESHKDQLIAALAEAGIPPERIVVGIENLSVADLIRGSRRSFRLGQESEWSLVAFLHYGAHAPSWELSNGFSMSYEQIARDMLKNEITSGICAGTHRLYTLSLALKSGRAEKWMTTELCNEVEAYLQRAADQLAETQLANGAWKKDWGKSATSAPTEGARELIYYTGHHIEWLICTPEAVAVSEHMLQRACEYVAAELLKVPDEVVLKNYCGFSHSVAGLLHVLNSHSTGAAFAPGIESRQ